ncbi:hypothetical protein GX95_04070 [Salmonella enterica subsp. enterica serovar Minnesota]|nr:hypothetical protein GX95_04070 [Salmonella enterica subsp. enterica serovar Minnesota]EAO9207723.1 hypothetical protein [Salmonella enterica]EBK9620924.1 hypothetical protein [Salmonella enterica]ECE0872375.1 hypothetical protein [Salmonella enterica subsp. enterica serovar Abaetetuba]
MNKCLKECAVGKWVKIIIREKQPEAEAPVRFKLEDFLLTYVPRKTGIVPIKHRTNRNKPDTGAKG